MRHLLIVIIFFAFTVNAAAQHSAKIKEGATITANAVVKKDYTTLIEYTYPMVVAMLGGKENFIKAVKKGIDDMAANGIYISKAVVGEPGEVFNAGAELHCLIPQTLTLKSDKGYLVSSSYLLAVSKDNGKRWYFIDTAPGEQQIKQIFPNFNNKLVIPKPTQPTLYRDSI